MTLNWGILGLGKIANRFADDISIIDGNKKYAVASRDLKKAVDFKDKHGFSYAYDSYESLINDSSVDIVYIALPHTLHCEWSLKAMDAGKHVLCEKPMAINTNEVQKMINASIANNVFLMEALWSRFIPTIERALNLVKSGALGRVSYVNADFCISFQGSDTTRMLDPHLGGGSLLDLGIYPLFLSYLILGYSEEISASANFKYTGVDAQVAIIISYDRAMSIFMSSIENKAEMNAKIGGSDGSITIPSRWHETDTLYLHTNKEVVKEKFNIQGGGYSYEIQECYDCILNGNLQSKRWSHQNSLELVQMMDNIRHQIDLKYPFEA